MPTRLWVSFLLFSVSFEMYQLRVFIDFLLMKLFSFPFILSHNLTFIFPINGCFFMSILLRFTSIIITSILRITPRVGEGQSIKMFGTRRGKKWLEEDDKSFVQWQTAKYNKIKLTRSENYVCEN